MHQLSRINHFPIRHYYDLSSLSHILEEAQFSKVTEHAFRESDCPNLEIIEPRAGGLSVEAEKTGGKRAA